METAGLGALGPVVIKVAPRTQSTVNQTARPSAPNTPLALLQLRRARRYEDVLHLFSSSGDATRGEAVEALLRVARTLTIFDSRVLSQARTSRARAEAARRDARYGPLATAVLESAQTLPLRELDLARSAFASLGDRESVRALSGVAAARLASETALAELEEAADAASVRAVVLAAETPGGTPLTAVGAVAAAEALSRMERVQEEPSGEAWAALAVALARHAPSMPGELPSRALRALAHCRAREPPPPSLVISLAERLLRRNHQSPTLLIRLLTDLRRLKALPLPATLRAPLARHATSKLQDCPADKAAWLVRAALEAGASWASLQPAAGARLRDPLVQRAAADLGVLRSLARALEAEEGAGAAEAAAGLRAAASAALFQPAAAQAAGGAAASAQRGDASSFGPGSLLPQAGRAPRRAPPATAQRRAGRAATARCRAASAGTEAPPLNAAAVALSFSVPALGGLLFGYDIGGTGGALASLRDAGLSGTDWGAGLSPLQSGALISASLFAAMAASVAALAFGERAGRLAELRCAAALYVAGCGLQALAPSYDALLLGRAVYGLGIGCAMHAAPLYLGETADARVRGALISAKEAAIVLGILGGYVAGAAFSGEPAGWRSVFACAAAAALPMAALSIALPESPRWLLAAGRGEAPARAALARLRGASPSDARLGAELAAMAAVARAADAEAAPSRGAGALLEPRNRRALYIGVSLMLFQQITGQPTVLYYAVDVFRAAGFGDAAGGVSVVLGGWKLGMTLLAVSAVDRLGRRPLLLGGVGALSGALFVLALLASPASPLEGGAASGASLAALLLYVGAYQLSFGPISWLMVGEIFPAAVRSEAVGLATVVNFGSNAVVAAALPSLQAAAGPAGTYALFGGLGVLALASIALTVPETKGKTLEEIQADLQ